MLIIGCGNTPAPAPAPAPAPTPTPAPAPTPAPGVSGAAPGVAITPSAIRARGPVMASLHVPPTGRVAGMPLLVRLDIENTGTSPIPFRDGGDWYAPGPLHFTWRVTDHGGAVECDLRADPGMLAGGGASTITTLAPGATHSTWLAPQTGCATLLSPGHHHLRVVRILTVDEDAPAACSTILVPDVTLDPVDDHGVPVEPACLRFLMTAPAVAAELDVEILPYQASLVRESLRAELAIEDDEGRRTALGQYATWLMLRLGREPSWGAPTEAAVEALMAALPERLPE
jgi:hypothetical protein